MTDVRKVPPSPTAPLDNQKGVNCRKTREKKQHKNNTKQETANRLVVP